MNSPEIGSAVELHNVFLRSDRGEQVFRDLEFTLQTGRSAVITGPAGAGKSSFVALLVGTKFAESGSVEVFGRLVMRRRRRLIKHIRRQIGGVGGIFRLMPTFTVAENVCFPLVLAGVRKRVRRERLFKVLTDFSLLKQAREYPHGLTRVESTLVQFARATIANQPLLIVDEPAAGLDSRTFQSVFEYLVKVSLSGRSMIILTSEPLNRELPNTDYYRISGGGLA